MDYEKTTQANTKARRDWAQAATHSAVYRQAY